MTNEEIIHGVITDAKGGIVKVFRTEKHYDLIFTDKRLLAALTANTGKAMMLGGDVGYLLSKSRRGKQREAYQQMSIEDIANASKYNMSIRYEDFKWVNIRKVMGFCGFNLECSIGKVSFLIPKTHLENAKKMVSLFLKNKVREK